ncbi:mannitol-1-phosphate 5-dehydrogenase [Mycena amicta]|nr:mannitol-1-phosphate 5-dehydrogenase [Mycena amicta]
MRTPQLLQTTHNMTPKPRAIHFGAGNIGRGFIAPLLLKSGYHVVFADVDKELIETINRDKSYDIHVLDTTAEDGGDGDAETETQVEEARGVRGVLSTTDDIFRELEHPRLKLVTTAVGLSVLDKIAPTIAKGLKARRTAGAGTINVIACENAIGATEQFAEKVDGHLDEEDRAYVASHVGFANCSVDRIVPPFEAEQHGSDSVLDVGVEEFFEWVVDETALKGSKGPGKLDVPVDGMTLTTQLPAYNERKLFTLNCGHAITAYLGFLKGLETIDASIADPDIAAVVRGALHGESGAALCKRHDFDAQKHGAYIEKIITRFTNAAVKDDVARVGRQPLRKLGQNDRLVGPARMCVEYGLGVRHLAMGIAAALHYEEEDDEQSKEMRKGIEDKGLEAYVAELTGFDKGSEPLKQIVEAYARLEEWKQ